MSMIALLESAWALFKQFDKMYIGGSLSSWKGSNGNSFLVLFQKYG